MGARGAGRKVRSAQDPQRAPARPRRARPDPGGGRSEGGGGARGRSGDGQGAQGVAQEGDRPDQRSQQGQAPHLHRSVREGHGLSRRCQRPREAWPFNGDDGGSPWPERARPRRHSFPQIEGAAAMAFLRQRVDDWMSVLPPLEILQEGSNTASWARATLVAAVIIALSAWVPFTSHIVQLKPWPAVGAF